MANKEQAILVKEDDSKIEVSCFISQSHQRILKPLQNPVEKGFDITDHINAEPFTLSLKGITTDYPLSFGATVDAVRSLIDNQTGQARYPSNDTFKAFDELYNTKELITIVTAYYTYTNMLMTSFRTTENAENS